MQFIMNIILYFVKTQEIEYISLIKHNKINTTKYKRFMGNTYILSSTIHDEKKRFRKMN